MHETLHQKWLQDEEALQQSQQQKFDLTQQLQAEVKATRDELEARISGERERMKSAIVLIQEEVTGQLTEMKGELAVAKKVVADEKKAKEQLTEAINGKVREIAALQEGSRKLADELEQTRAQLASSDMKLRGAEATVAELRGLQTATAKCGDKAHADGTGAGRQEFASG
jgi:chromosome segregation ATPase